MFEIFEIWFCHIFEFFWLSKVTRNISKRLMGLDGDGDKNKVYLNITDNFYPLVNVIIRLDGY